MNTIIKRIAAIAAGFLPLVFGILMNGAILSEAFSTKPFPFFAAGLGTLALWFLLGFLAAKWRFGKTAAQVMLLLSLPGAAMLLLVGIQELLLGQYWQNAAGAAGQIFFLPVINLGASLTLWSGRMFPAYCASFVLLCAAAWLGGKTGSR